MKAIKFVLALLIINLLQNGQCQNAKTKTWIPNTNYDEPSNWLGYKFPCEGSKIIFPEELNVAIYLPENMVVQEIELPNDGELIMKEEGMLELTEQTAHDCQQKEAYFKKINIEPWFSPSNWRTNTTYNPSTPHAEQVPCNYDDVVFPHKSSFWVQYPETAISVRSFTIEGQSLTNDQLQTFLLSEPGGRQFHNLDYQYRTDVINVNTAKCSDKTGCLCHDSNFVEKAVCKNWQRVCNVTHCLTPVKPVGHCCEICGAYLKLKYNSNFDFIKFERDVQAHLNIFGYTDVSAYVSKVLAKEGTYIQIVIVEKDFKYNGDSISAAQELQNLLISDMKEFNLISSTLVIAGPEYYPGEQLRRTVAIVLGTLFMVLVTLIILYFKYETEEGKKMTLPFNLPNLRNFRPFIFVRFENAGDTDTGLEFRNRSVASSLFNMDRAFENPMFEEPEASTSQRIEEVTEKQHIDFKNPLFSNLKQKDVSDEE